MKYFLLLLALCAVSSCKNNAASTSAADNARLKYPFKPRYSINWQPGDEKNAVIVLNCLKKYIAGDVKGAGENFADSAEFISDGFYFNGKRDSLINILAQVRGEMTEVTKEFDSWMTTYYPDKKDTWVTLWYVEKWTDKKGKRDSLCYTDDVMLRDGKIKIYDEKIRHFAPAEIKK